MRPIPFPGLNRFSATTLLLALVWMPAGPARAAASALNTVAAQASADAATTGFDGVVEAVRQTVIAAQVAGAVVALQAKVGDRVAAGQLLLRIDARAADQNAAASDAQLLSARVSLDLAAKDFERQKQLFNQKYISQAALDHAEAQFKATQAQVSAQLAQAGAARTQSGFYAVRAPFAGVVAEVPVSLGDMAMPGRPLLTLYDPSALRITAAVPQTVASSITAGAPPRIELPGLPAASQWPSPARVQVLPTVDPATHTVQLRIDLPPGAGALAGVAPGMFARVWLPVAGVAGARSGAVLSVPVQAVVRRAEMTGLYVLGANGAPLLRQVRLGRTDGDRVEILSGLTAGERVVTDPAAAARQR